MNVTLDALIRLVQLAQSRQATVEVLGELADTADTVHSVERVRATIENQHANDQVRELRRTGTCPCCGADA